MKSKLAFLAPSFALVSLLCTTGNPLAAQQPATDVAPAAAAVPVTDVPEKAAEKPAEESQSDRAEPLVKPTAKVGADLRFNFSGAEWRSVLEWFSDEADLSLQLDQIPMGSFTFTDPTRSYSIDEALDVLNLSLMKRGYSLVRRGRLLQVIDLEAENANKLISEIAELVKPEDLDARGRSDIVSSVFPLGSLTPSAAREELVLMVGPWGRVVVLDSARQVKVTETVSKLIAIRELLQDASLADTNVVEIVLKNRGAEELLEIARPLLGLEAGTNAGEDVRISVGPLGDRIYATGLPGQTGLLESIIAKADQPLAIASADDGAEVALPTFRTHPITNADSATVFDVLQTLLAGTPDARIAIDPKTDAIVAFARPDTHEMIKRSIAEMEGNGESFKVLDLRRLDPAQALLTINKFFGVTEEGGEGPTVDGDPASGKLWVRGTDAEIALVEKLLAELEGDDHLSELSDKVRILPYTGRAAEDALNQVQELWPVMGRANRIRTVTPSRPSGGSGGIPERRVIRESDLESVDDRPRSVPAGSEARTNRRRTSGNANTLVVVQADTPEDSSDTNAADADSDSLAVAENENTTPTTSQTISVAGSDIVVQFTPAGILIASEDVEALNAFESLMGSLAGPSAVQSDLPTVFWLKYCKADEAAELISKILGGADSSASSAMDSMMGGLGGGMLGGLLGMGGGGGGESSSAKSILTTTGSVSIVPDARLNALIIQAGPIDLQMIELILEKIDRQESPEDVETAAKPLLIPVIYQDAKEVADVVKAVFGDRIAGQDSGGGGRGGGGGGQPSPQDFIQALRGGGGGRGGRGGGGEAAGSEPSKISIAVDQKSNSLVVIATPQDFNEVRALVEQLDAGGMTTEETISTYTMNGAVNPDVLKLALESILGTQAKSSSTTATSSSSSTTRPTTSTGGGDAAASSAADIQRRIEFFRSMRGGGDTGGGRGGAPGGGRGGTTGGGRGGAPGGGGGRRGN
ncbi:Bacterial type II/III secretion system short domain protein [Rubripirellula lacrimiformis]|uniref:Bacterial type II/III secretion system short domain protein n=1 Tax=Rubripirellula lacrimiformis TaxID=1930273 RepID=A0A517NC88_9BACT|nr:secretin N-terminal domain-containing protein [Rubripirellula lacrimiformis]QDT04750.1 Bacterial type II/III secretion system short domain protein [Rubripirellula lacrimiformis]